jgi:serine/threonine protein kinase
MLGGPVADFAEAVRHCRLMEPAQMEELAGSLQDRFPAPRELAGELIRRGWLTAYQVNQLFRGRGDGLLLGSYVLLERLGAGGMGQVFKARNWKLGQVVALKLIRKDRLTRPEAVRRFHREIQAAAQLNHSNVVRAYDADQAGEVHFLVTEYVEGTDLGKLVKRHGPLPVADACDYARQAALGLQHAFERGLVHRDIKPHNLLRTPQSVVKVLDMGLARLTRAGEDGEATSMMTEEGAVIGTADYIAPEQARDAHGADIRADLYSLGCTLYHLLAGRPPFAGGSAVEKLLGHQMDQPPPLEQWRPEVPPEVAAVVRRLMAKRPEERYQTPAAAAAALAGTLRATSAVAPPVTPAPLKPPPVPAAAAGETLVGWSSVGAPLALAEAGRRPAGGQRRRLCLGVAGVVALLGLVGLLLALERLPSPPAPEPQPPPVQRGKRRPMGAGAFDRWARGVAGLPAEQQVAVVAAKLKEANPGFDGAVRPTIENGVVTGLELQTDGVKDIAPVRALGGLKSLSCPGSAAGKGLLADLSPLRGLQLSSLNCSNTKVANLLPLKCMPLTSLACAHTGVSSLWPLKGMSLASLICDGAPVDSLAPLKDMPLTALECDDTKVTDLLPLKGMLSLKSLHCRGTKVADLAPLKGLRLTSLACASTDVTDLGPLKGLPLTLLSCSDTAVADLSALEGMPLARLLCDNTRVDGLAPLKGMPLKELACSNTRVADLSPLKGLQLTSLGCEQAAVTDLSPLKGMPLKELRCDFQKERDTEVLRALKALAQINGKPAAQFWQEVDAMPPKS